MAAIDSNVTHVDGTVTLTAASVSMDGTVAATAGSAPVTVTGTGTNFLDDLSPGDNVTIADADGASGTETVTVATVASNTSFTTADDVANTFTAKTVTVAYVMNKWVSADLDFGLEMGEVRCVGNRRKDHTNGKKTATGTITKVFGAQTMKFLNLLQRGASFTFAYDAGNNVTGTMTGCKATNVPINIDGGSSDAITTAIPFRGTDYTFAVA